jgi:hypothetical protein
VRAALVQMLAAKGYKKRDKLLYEIKELVAM